MKYHRPFRGLYSFYYPFDVPYLSISDVSGNASNWDNKPCKNTSQNVIYMYIYAYISLYNNKKILTF